MITINKIIVLQSQVLSYLIHYKRGCNIASIFVFIDTSFGNLIFHNALQVFIILGFASPELCISLQTKWSQNVPCIKWTTSQWIKGIFSVWFITFCWYVHHFNSRPWIQTTACIRVQSGAVLTQSIITWYQIQHPNNNGRSWIIIWTHTTHPLSRLQT